MLEPRRRLVAARFFQLVTAFAPPPFCNLSGEGQEQCADSHIECLCREDSHNVRRHQDNAMLSRHGVVVADSRRGRHRQ